MGNVVKGLSRTNGEARCNKHPGAFDYIIEGRIAAVQVPENA
jgi:hypothetical protein